MLTAACMTAAAADTLPLRPASSPTFPVGSSDAVGVDQEPELRPTQNYHSPELIMLSARGLNDYAAIYGTIYTMAP